MDDFLNTMSSFCFQLQILQPTRVTDHSATVIDNIFFNSLEHFTISGNIIYDISDHLPNFLIFDKFSSLSNNVTLYKSYFSKLDSHSSPLFKSLELINFFDIALFQIAFFMCKFYNNVLPAAFHSLFTNVTSVHNYNTRFAAKHSYYLPYMYARTNYGKFNIRFQGPSVWNTIDDSVKLSSSTLYISLQKTIEGPIF